MSREQCILKIKFLTSSFVHTIYVYWDSAEMCVTVIK